MTNYICTRTHSDTHTHIYIQRERERKHFTALFKVFHTLLNFTLEVSIDKIMLNKTKYLNHI